MVTTKYNNNNKNANKQTNKQTNKTKKNNKNWKDIFYLKKQTKKQKAN